jgi:TPR repeat protein
MTPDHLGQLHEFAAHAQRMVERGHYTYAEKLLRRLVAHRVPAAFGLLGRVLRIGFGASPAVDQIAAYHLFAEGDALGDVESTVGLARCVGTGVGCDKDEVRAFALAKKAADLGSVHGQAMAAQCLLNGVGCECDLLQALPWLEKLVDEAIPDLLYSLGYILMIDEDGYPRDPSRAAKLFERAARAGSEEACGALVSIARHAGDDAAAVEWIGFMHGLIPDSEVDAYFAQQPDTELKRLYLEVRAAELGLRHD